MSEYPFTISTYNPSKRSILFLSSSGETLLTISSAGIVFNSDIPADDLAKEIISIIEKNYPTQQEDHVSKKALREWCEVFTTRPFSVGDNEDKAIDRVIRMIMSELLEKFCKEGES